MINFISLGISLAAVVLSLASVRNIHRAKTALDETVDWTDRQNP